MTPEQFKEIQKEFLRFGYDPYNSYTPKEWAACMEAKLETP